MVIQVLRLDISRYFRTLWGCSFSECIAAGLFVRRTAPGSRYYLTWEILGALYFLAIQPLFSIVASLLHAFLCGSSYNLKDRIILPF